MRPARSMPLKAACAGSSAAAWLPVRASASPNSPSRWARQASRTWLWKSEVIPDRGLLMVTTPKGGGVVHPATAWVAVTLG